MGYKQSSFSTLIYIAKLERQSCNNTWLTREFYMVTVKFSLAVFDFYFISVWIGESLLRLQTYRKKNQSIMFLRCVEIKLVYSCLCMCCSSIRLVLDHKSEDVQVCVNVGLVLCVSALCVQVFMYSVYVPSEYVSVSDINTHRQTQTLNESIKFNDSSVSMMLRV